MAQPEEIPTDLALEVGANLDPKRFIDVARHFFGYIEEVANSINGNEKPKWEVIARQGSTILAMQPVQNFDILTLSDLYQRLDAASVSLTTGNIEHSHLSEKALKHIQMLAELRDREGNKVPVRFWIKKNPTLIGPDVGESIRESQGREYFDFGSLEGALQTIQDSGGNLEFRIRDELYRNPIKCIVREELLPAILVNFRKRVEVTGEIKYSRYGLPLEITVSSIDSVPSDDELPSAEDVRGILAEQLRAM
jgi:hypothetical protein